MKRQHILFLGLLTATFLLKPVVAMAQFAPGSNSAATPSSSEPPALPDTQATSSSGNDACPEPKRALGSTPDDLAKIQEDITRFTLCVQRAQLLERLNELAESNIETIDSALNLTVNNNADDGNAVPGIMPSIPMPQLPDSVSNLLNSEDSASDPSMAMGSSQPASSSWRIRNIEGKGGEITAQLVGDDGTYIKVTKGQTLPDDGGRVVSVSNTSVRIEKDGEKMTLRWVE